MNKVLNGREIAQSVNLSVKHSIESRNLKLKLAVIRVGEDKASDIYIRNKKKKCEEVGIGFIEHRFYETAETKHILTLLKSLNHNEEITGIMVQLPLPKHINQEEIFSAIDPNKDVDGFNPINRGKLTIGEDTLIPCTPKGVLYMLDYSLIGVEGKSVTIIGRSNIVGKPLAQLLTNNNATVTLCHSKTVNLKDKIKQADIVISAIGRPKIIGPESIKKGAVIIDVGINRLYNNKIVGDIDYERCYKKSSYITPVPGGVGPMTVAMLMMNTLKAYELQNRTK